MQVSQTQATNEWTNSFSAQNGDFRVRLYSAYNKHSIINYHLTKNSITQIEFAPNGAGTLFKIESTCWPFQPSWTMDITRFHATSARGSFYTVLTTKSQTRPVLCRKVLKWTDILSHKITSGRFSIEYCSLTSDYENHKINVFWNSNYKAQDVWL